MAPIVTGCLKRVGGKEQALDQSLQINQNEVVSAKVGVSLYIIKIYNYWF